MRFIEIRIFRPWQTWDFERRVALANIQRITKQDKMRGKENVHIQDLTPYSSSRRSPMTISQAILETEERLCHDESLKRMLSLLQENLSKNAKRKYFVTIA